VVRGRAIVVPRGPVRAHQRGKLFEETRQRIAARDRWRCQLCWQPIDPALRKPHPRALAVGHRVALADGGTDVDGNLEASHAECNLRAGR
jgi:5-methylcytosine-specific restriction endonuclease McrA